MGACMVTGTWKRGFMMKKEYTIGEMLILFLCGFCGGVFVGGVLVSLLLAGVK